MTDPDLSDDARDVADETFAEIDDKVLLVQMLTELQQIRRALTDAEQAADSPPEYRCRKCGDVMPEGDRKRHAEKQHRAPPGTEDALFERVD